MAADPGPIIITRAELQRRTRERSRLAAAKVAEEHGKERKQRETAAKRKADAKAIAAQARRDNAVRFRRISSSAGPPETASRRRDHRAEAAATGFGVSRARSHSPRGVSETRGRSQAIPAADGSKTRGWGGDQSAATTSSARGRPRSGGPPKQQQQQQQQQQHHQIFQGQTRRLSRSAGSTRQDDEPPLPALRRRVLRGRDTGEAAAATGNSTRLAAGARWGSESAAVVEGGSGQSSRERAEKGDEVPSGAGDVGRAAQPDNSADASTAKASPEEAVPAAATSSRPAASSAAAGGRVAGAVAESAPRAAGRSSTESRLRGQEAAARRVAERREQEQRQQERRQREQQEERRRSAVGAEKDGSGGSRHRKTLAFMARQRKQALMEKRKLEQEKLENADNLRRALEKLEQTRRQGISQQRPLRSHSRENMHASRQIRSATTAPQVRTGLSRPSSAGARGGRRPPHGTSPASGPDQAPPPAQPRPAWVNVVDGNPQPESPVELHSRRPLTQGLRRLPIGKENKGGAEAGAGGDTGGGRRLERRRITAPSSSRAAPPRSSSGPGRGMRRPGEDDPSRNSSAPSRSVINASTRVVARSVRRRDVDACTASEHAGAARSGRPATPTAGAGAGKGSVAGRNTVDARAGRSMRRSGDSGGGSHPQTYGGPPSYDAVGRQALRRDDTGVTSTAQRRWRPSDGWGEGDGGSGGNVGEGVGAGNVRRRRRRDGGPSSVRSPEVEVSRAVVRGSEETRQDAVRERFHGEEFWQEEKTSRVRPEVRQGREEEAVAESAGRLEEEKEDEKEGGGVEAEGKVSSHDLDTGEGEPPDERLPFMLASLQRVALTVQDLQGRCARLSHALEDEPRSGPPLPPSSSDPVLRAPASRTSTATARDKPSSRVDGVLGQLSSLSHVSVGEQERRSAPRRSQLQQRSREQEEERHQRQPPPRSSAMRERVAERPAITVPTPVVLPPRQPPPVFYPPNSPQHDEHGSPGKGGGEEAAKSVAPHPVDTASSVRPAAAEGLAETVSPVSASPPPVEDAWNSPLGAGRAAMRVQLRVGDDAGEDVGGGAGGGIPRTDVASEATAAASGEISRLSRRSSNRSAIAEILRKLREPPRADGGEARLALSSDAAEGRVGAGGGAAEHRRTGPAASTAEAAAPAAKLNSDDLPEWMARARNGNRRGRGRLTQQAFRGADGGQGGGRGSRSRSSSSVDEEEEGGRRGGAGAHAGGFSLVSLVAGDIVRAQREEAARRRREKEAAVSAASAATTAAAAAGASKAPEERQSKETRLAASENAVAEAVRAAARVVAVEEAAHGDGSASAAVRMRKSSIDGMDAVEEAMAALEERKADGAGASGVSEPAGGDSAPGRGDSRPDLWDTLLQSGPALSTARRDEIQGSSRPGVSVEAEAKADDDAEHRWESEGSPFGENASTQERVPFGGSGTGNDGGGGAEGEGRRRRRLSPAELQAQLLNELRLHDDLQDVELKADGLMAAQRVEEARREAKVAGLLLHRERSTKAQTDGLLEQQQVFEEALARNDATHKARLLRLTREADDRAARQAETATVAVAAASAAALGAHGRQAGASVAAVAAAGMHARKQQATAMAAQAAMFLEFQERAMQRGREMAQSGARGSRRAQADRDRLSDAGSLDEPGDYDHDRGERRQMRGRSPEKTRSKGRQERNDFDSLLEHSPVHNSHNILHPGASSSTAAAAAAAAAARGRQQAREKDHGFWPSEDSQSPERKERRATSTARGSSKSDQVRGGGARQHQSRKSGSVTNGGRGSGRLSSSGGGGGGGRESSPVRHLRHSSDGLLGSAAGARRQQQGGPPVSAGRGSSSTGLGGANDGNRGPSAVGDGGVVDEHDLDALLDYRMAALRDSTRRQQWPSHPPMDPLRRSGPVSLAGRAVGAGGTPGSGSGGAREGAASVEYAAVRREIELEREAMSRRTQEQLRELEDDDGDGESEEGVLGDQEEDEERYTSFGSSVDADGSNAQEDRYPPLVRRHRAVTPAGRDGVAGSAENGESTGSGPGSLADDVDEAMGSLSPVAGDYSLDTEAREDGEGGDSLYIAESLALELQENVVPVAAAGRRLRASSSRPDDAADRVESGGEPATGRPEEDGSDTSIPDDAAVPSSSESSATKAIPDGSPTADLVEGADPGTSGGEVLDAEPLEDGEAEVPEEVASGDSNAEALPDLSPSGSGDEDHDKGGSDGGGGDGEYGSGSFEADASEDQHGAQAAEEVESEGSVESAAPAAEQYSQDFEASLPEPEAGAASGPLSFSPGDGASEGMLSPPDLHEVLDGGLDDSGSGDGASSSTGACGGLQPGSSGSLASMEATVARRRDKVQQMKGKLKGLQESRGRVRAKRALAQQLESLEAEESQLLQELPLQEEALAEEEKELHGVMTRERRDAEARSPAATTAAADATASRLGVAGAEAAGVPPAENGAHEGQPSLPPWGEEKLWSDSDSDVYDAGRYGDREDGGVEESKLSAPPMERLGRATSPKNVDEGEATAGICEGGASDNAEAAAVTADAVPDLLVNGGYVDIETANPPALSEWIALGAAEARDAHLAVEGPHDEQRPPPPQSNKDIDEDSFCSSGYGGGGIIDHYRGTGVEEGDSSDADSEARLTALVARVAVRGEESRAALIVQALVRGRAARKFAAAERGRECAREEAAAHGGATALPPSPATAADDGSAEEARDGLLEKADSVEDMAWLARKERRACLSDSFASSDSEGGKGSALLMERNAEAVAACKQEHAWLSRAAEREEDTALAAATAAIIHSTLEPQEPGRDAAFRKGREAQDPEQEEEEEEEEEDEKEERGEDTLVPQVREETVAGGSSESLVEEILEESFGEAAGDEPEAEISAASPATADLPVAKKVEDEGHEGARSQDGAAVGFDLADEGLAEANRGSAGASVDASLEESLSGTCPLHEYHHIEAALPPDEDGEEEEEVRRGDSQCSSLLDGEDDDMRETFTVEGVGDEETGIVAKEGVPAGGAPDFQGAFDSPASAQASDTPPGTGDYSESFEDDHEQEGEEEEEANEGREGGAIVQHFPGDGSGADLAPVDPGRDSPVAKAYGGEAVSSASEVCSEVFSAEEDDERSSAGSFSAGQDYVEAALSPSDQPEPAEAGVGGDNALSWQALVFDASPPTVRGGGAVDAAVAEGGDAEFSPSVCGDGHSQAEDGVSVVPTAAGGDTLTEVSSDEEKEEEGGEMVTAREDEVDKRGDGILEGQCWVAGVLQNAPGGAERRPEERAVEENSDGGFEASRDDGVADDTADGLLLPSPTGSLDAVSMKSFLVSDEPLGDRDAEGQSATPSEDGRVPAEGNLDGEGAGSGVDEIPDLPEPVLGEGAPAADLSGSSAMMDDPEKPMATVDTSHGSVEEVTVPVAVASPASVDAGSGSNVGGEEVQSLDNGYSFVEDANPVDEGHGEGGEGGDDRNSNGEVEAFGADGVDSDSTALPLSSPAAAEEPGPLGDVGADGACKIRPAVVAAAAAAAAAGCHEGAGLFGSEDGGEREPSAHDGLHVGNGADMPFGVTKGGDGDEEESGAWSGRYDFEEDAVAPSPGGDAPAEKEVLDVGKAAGSSLGVEKGGEDHDGDHDGDDDDGDIGASSWSEGYDYEEDAAAVGPSTQGEAPRDDDEGLLPAETNVVAAETGKRVGGGETGGGYRAWATGESAYRPSDDDDDVPVVEEAAVQETDEPQEEERARLEAFSSSPPAEVEDASGLDAFDHVEVAVRPSSEDTDASLQLQRSEEQSPAPGASGVPYHPQDEPHEVHEGFGAVGDAGDENAAPAVSGSSLESFGGVEAGGDDDPEAPPLQQQTLPGSAGALPTGALDGNAPVSFAVSADPAAERVGYDEEHEAASEVAMPSVGAEEEGVLSAPEIGSIGDGERGGMERADPVVSGDGDVDDLSATAVEPVIHAAGAASDATALPNEEEEAGHGEAGAVATFTSGHLPPSMSEHETPAAVPQAADCAAAPSDEGATAVAHAKLGGDKEQLVDDITDRLLASLLQRALSAPHSSKSAASPGKEGATDPAPAIKANGSGVDTGVEGGGSEGGEIVRGSGGDESGSRPSPTKWEGLTSGEDTKSGDKQGLSGEDRLPVESEATAMAAGTEGYWGTAAMTETYRSEEGMLMVVRDNSSDDGGGSDSFVGNSPQQGQQGQQQRHEEGRRTEEEQEEEAGVQGGRATPLESDGSSGGGTYAAAGRGEADEEEDEYYFPPVALARPKKPWMALATQPTNGDAREGEDSLYKTSGAVDTPGEVSFGVRSGGGANSNVSLGSRNGEGGVTFEGGDAGLLSPSIAAAQVSLGIRSGGVVNGGGWGEDATVGETLEYTEEGQAAAAEGEDAVEHTPQVEAAEEDEEGERFAVEEDEVGWPEYPWWPVLADAIETSLRSMTLDELNGRMAMHYLPDEPFIEELEGQDGMEFPPPPEAPLEDEAVIPPRVIDELLDAPDDEILGSLTEMEGIPQPDRDALDSARWMAYDAANEYLAEQRSMRAPRRPSDPPAPSGKLLHRIEGFRHFRSMEEAILEVTSAVLGQDGACLPGREQNPDFVEMLPLDNKPEEWLFQEDDAHIVKCRVAEGILEELVDDTVRECKRVYALRERSRERWAAELSVEAL